MNKFKWILLTLIAWASCAQGKAITKKDLVGLWRIVDFTITSQNGEQKKWAEKIHGTIFYDQNNFMSVSINGNRKGESVYIFYSGKYIVDQKNMIMHRVDNASDPNRINKTMIRSASYKNGILTLTAYGNYGTAVIKWERFNLR